MPYELVVNDDGAVLNGEAFQLSGKMLDLAGDPIPEYAEFTIAVGQVEIWQTMKDMEMTEDEALEYLVAKQLRELEAFREKNRPPVSFPSAVSGFRNRSIKADPKAARMKGAPAG